MKPDSYVDVFIRCVHSGLSCTVLYVATKRTAAVICSMLLSLHSEEL